MMIFIVALIACTIIYWFLSALPLSSNPPEQNSEGPRPTLARARLTYLEDWLADRNAVEVTFLPGGWFFFFSTSPVRY